MNFVVYGEQNLIIKKTIKKISKDILKEIDDLNFVSIDLNEHSLEEAVDEVSLLPLGYERKIVLLENAYFLLKEYDVPKEFKEDFSKCLELLTKIIKESNDEINIIFSLNSKDIDQNNEIFKTIKANGKVSQLLSLSNDDWYKYVSIYFKKNLNVEIDNDAIYEIINRVENNLNIFVNEADKLSLYTDHVTYDDVVKLVHKPVDANIFDIFKHLIMGKNDNAIKIYRELKEANVEPVQIIATLANSFRLLLQISYLLRNGMTTLEAANELNIKEVRVKINKNYVYSVSLNRLEKILDELYELDYKIKSGQISDRFNEFEIYLSKFIL